MHSPRLADRDAQPTLDVRLAELNVSLDVPRPLRATLNATLVRVPRASSEPALTVAVREHSDGWEISGGGRSSTVIPASSTMPEIAGAVFSRVRGDVATERGYKTMRAAVVERDGDAVALVGDDWQLATSVAAHLHVRGWNYVGSDSVFFDADNHAVVPIQKSLFLNSTCIDRLPTDYRRAVEVSPWYVTPRGISFYAVDPTIVGRGGAWGNTATLRGAVLVHHVPGEKAFIQGLSGAGLEHEQLARLNANWSNADAISLTFGSYFEACDLLERWFGTIRTRA